MRKLKQTAGAVALGLSLFNAVAENRALPAGTVVEVMTEAELQQELERVGGITVIDGFAGAGGTSLGLKLAGWKVVAMWNHDKDAVASHSANFPEVLHFRDDVRKLLAKLMPKADVIWISPDCTHHSIAKGGQSRDPDSRALAEEVLRFAYECDALGIMVENVPTFPGWGPVSEKRDPTGRIIYQMQKGKVKLDAAGDPVPVFVPIKERKAEYYNAWTASLRAMGYVNQQYRFINAADFGAPQTRVRYFGVFTRRGIPISWPQPTHDQFGRGGMPKWTPVIGCLDLENQGESIITREDVLCDNTLRRVIAGTKKQVLDRRDPAWLLKQNSTRPATMEPSPGTSLWEPAPTIGCQFLPNLVQAQYLSKAFSGAAHNSISLTGPAGTITTVDHHHLVTAHFITQNNGGDERSRGLDQPGYTATCSGGQQFLTSAQFVLSNYGFKAQSSALDVPNPTLVVNPKQHLVSSVFLTNPSWYGWTHSADEPCPTVVASQHKAPLGVVQALFQNNGTRANDSAERLTMPLDGQAPTITTGGGNLYLATFIDAYYGNGFSRSSDQPAPTVMTKDRLAAVSVHGFTMAQQFDNEPRGFREPARTIVASRRHQYAVFIVPGTPEHLRDQPADSAAMKELKALCRENGIYDIRMRMLTVPELKRIMGFPDSYILEGSITKQKKQLGNAVVPAVAKALAEAMAPALLRARSRKLAPLSLSAVEKWEQGDLFAQMLGKEVAHA